jgi:hypothetical protein
VTIKNNIQKIKQTTSESEKKYHRELNSVQLIAVSKKQSVEKIMEAIKAGQTHFGESYVQEAIPKIEYFKNHVKTNLTWHFIGPIQSNKTKSIAEHFDWVHGVDRLKIAERLNDQRPNHLSPMNICIQVNLDSEETKSGVPIEKVEMLAQELVILPRLRLRGLMTIPEPCNDIKLQRQKFKRLRECLENLNKNGFVLDTLSMGMSDDFESAIAEGATMIRIGTMIFGGRVYDFANSVDNPK